MTEDDKPPTTAKIRAQCERVPFFCLIGNRYEESDKRTKEKHKQRQPPDCKVVRERLLHNLYSTEKEENSH